MNKFATTFAVCLAFFLTSCSQPPTDELNKSTKTTPITIAQFGHVFLYMPLYVAQDRGFFTEEGLNANFVSTGGDEKTFTAVSAGNAQFGVSDPVFAAIARERGQGGKVVASIVTGTPFWIITYKNDIKPVKAPTELKGPAAGRVYRAIDILFGAERAVAKSRQSHKRPTRAGRFRHSGGNA